MPGEDRQQSHVFSYVSPKRRLPQAWFLEPREHLFGDHAPRNELFQDGATADCARSSAPMSSGSAARNRARFRAHRSNCSRKPRTVAVPMLAVPIVLPLTMRRFWLGPMTWTSGVSNTHGVSATL